MGFFKKIFKGIKKVFKKIGKGIKSVFKSVGKFMGKIGIIGQIGLALVLPGVGQILSGMLVGTSPGVVGGLAGMLQGGGAIGQAASSFIQGAVKVAGRVGNFFSTVSEGVTKVVGETVGAFANSLGVTPDSFIGKGLGRVGVNVGDASWDNVWKATQDAMTSAVEAGGNIFTGAQDKAFAALREDTLTDTFGSGAESATQQVAEAPLLDTESALDRLTAERLKTDAALQRVTDVVPQTPLTPALDSLATEQLRQDTLSSTFGESLLSPADALQEVTVAAKKVPTKYTPPTFSERVASKAGELYDTGVAKAGEALSDLPRRAVEGATSQVMQAIGLEDVPEYEYNQYAIAVPTIDMGSTTGIGDMFNTGQAQEYYRAYSADLQSKPFGDLSSLYAYFDFMRQQGYTS